ncbi:glycoside hydrolase family 1 protein [Clostridium felsineum]|uniref:6-phospho-beta-glucosidase GmuD n=1 Tax=Clostridium felsineum TaxID=36839 RepID=A0A1S8LGR2_9CLOT|nr:glycoside hydrolase family 1 protein [Clostridium felsineum]URZ07358.1 6-phospho-beta-glucosidase GmuD [Clostridium felsineum]URZ12389.1 6-phospho-beta-glucosidase GmuD [Clostridium felsineum]
MKCEFKKDFLWGAATSGPQAEGRFEKHHDSVFDYWYDIEPEAFFDRVGPNVASNFYNSYKKDLAMMKSIGFNSFRTSIQWTRLIKDFETFEVYPEAVKFYNSVIDECIELEMEPFINLHHFDLPIELYKKYGGWESKHVVDLYEGFASKCFELFSDRVKHWITFNEPIVVVEGEYLWRFHYPKLVDGKKAVQVAYNLNLASAKAINAFKKRGYHKEGGKIGIVLNLTPSYPRSNSMEDKKAADFADMFYNRMFLDTAVKGSFPKELVEVLDKDNVLWDSSEKELEIIKENTVDYLGINYYQPRRVKEKEKLYDMPTWIPEKYFDNYIMPGRRINKHRGWEIYPKAIYDIAINIRDNYNNIPWYISENGIGVEGEEKFKNEEGVIEDDYRINFIKEHLQFLNKGIKEGSNCFGYHLWTPIDCWSWSNAYKNRYGFIALDLKTQIKTIKKSGYWFKKLTENRGF